MTLKSKIEITLYEILKIIPNKNADSIILNKVSLMGGISGMILLQSTLSQYFHDKQLKKEMYENISRLIYLLENEETLTFTFCDGIAGVGWLFIYLKDKKLIEIDVDEFLDEIDVTLSNLIDLLISDENYDFLNGLVGIGIYFLKRKKYDVVKRMISSLYSKISDEFIEIKFVNKNFNGNRYYDFGLAHGNAAILFFISKCYSLNILRTKCFKIIKGMVKFFFNNIQSNDSIAIFPYKIPSEQYKKDKTIQFCRLGWCYGDLSILHTLLLVSIWINDKKLNKRVLEMLKNKTSNRKSIKQTLINDAGFCHGAAGVGYIFYKLYKLTGEKIFLYTSTFWTKKTLQNSKGAGIGGKYILNIKTEKSISPWELLTGYAGIGLFLSSIISIDKNNDWDEIFLLS